MACSRCGVSGAAARLSIAGGTAAAGEAGGGGGGGGGQGRGEGVTAVGVDSEEAAAAATALKRLALVSEAVPLPESDYDALIAKAGLSGKLRSTDGDGTLSTFLIFPFLTLQPPVYVFSLPQVF